LKIEILNEIEPDENEIRSLKGKAEAEEDVYRKEEYYNEIDKIEKLIDEKLEKKLDTLIPRAFACKRTACRFTE
jgi:preprotein translocase subunit SecA